MLSPSNFDTSRLIDTTFITGLPYQTIIQYIKNADSSFHLSPEVLYSYPQRKDSINSSILEFIFPNGISVEYIPQKSKFHAIVLTNESGCRTYLYIMTIYEEILLNEVISQREIMMSSQSVLLSECKSLYFPYAICIWTTSPQVESFRKILLEMLKVMSYSDIHTSEETLKNYRHCELLHIIIFLSNIVKPGNYSRLLLNFHFSSVPFYFPSFNEIPSNEFNMKLLFDSLEISTIIKLWCSLLCEKHIILLGNQSILLFGVCEALMSLIFPFKWLHTYIPVLPNDQLDILECPTPYIMGALTSTVDYVYLKETYSTHVICDINTSVISSNGVSTLSQSEEAKLRKKLQYMKNPEIFDIEDIEYEELNESAEGKMIDIEDVDHNRSFAENIQYIFFRVFRNALNSMKRNFKIDSTFNVQSFLDDYCSEDMRDFWEKLSSTVAFEHFILSFQTLDDSFSKIFKNITQSTEGLNTKSPSKKRHYHSQDKLSSCSHNTINHTTTQNNLCSNTNHRNDAFTCEINLPKYFNDITEQFDNSINEFRQFLQKLNTDYLSIFNQIRTSIKPVNTLHEKVSLPGTTKQNISKSVLSYDFEATKEGEDIIVPIAKDWPPSKHVRHVGNYSNQSVNYNHLKTTFNKSMFHHHNQARESITIQMKTIQKKSTFRMYSQNGFLSFLKFLFKSIVPVNELGYTNHLLEQTLHLLLLKEEANFKLFNCSQIVEQEHEDYDSVYLRNSISEDKKELMTFNNCNCYQYYQHLAFMISDYSSPEQNKDKIIKLYEHSYSMNSQGFSRARFYQFLDTYNYYELMYLLNKMENEHLEINKKLLVKIIKARISKIQKNKRLSNKVSLTLNLINQSPKDKDEDDNNTNANGDNDNYVLSFKSGSNSNRNSNSNFNSNNKMKEEEEEPLDSTIQSITQQVKEMTIRKEESNGNLTPSLVLLKRKSTCDVRRITSRNTKLLLNNTTLSDIRKSFNNENNFDGLTDGEKIIEIFKATHEISNKDRLIKINVINLYEKFTATTKDPIALIEDISVELFCLVIKKAINKLQSDLISSKLLMTLSTSPDFLRIKKLVAELQVINITPLRYQEKNQLCFWLNAFNFLTLFTVIYKKEVPLTYYDWYRFLKNSYFNIGGYEISLFEIQNCILKFNKARIWINGELCEFAKDDKRNVLRIKNVPKQTFFCLCLPTASSPMLKIYFPSTISKLMTLNAIEYVNSNVEVDPENLSINIPEYLTWIDEDYSTHLLKYKEIFTKDFFEILEKYKTNATIKKYDWTINFEYIAN